MNAREPQPRKQPGKSLPPRPPSRPRAVRGGVKLTLPPPFGKSWEAVRWFRIAESAASAELLAQGLVYARAGQVRRLAVEPGQVVADVQGRAARAYQTRLSFDQFTPEEWDRVIGGMLDQPAQTARLLSGEPPGATESIFAPLGLSLIPERVETTCSCVRAEPRDPLRPADRPPARWCKHACCVAALVAERLASDPLTILMMRGMTRAELLERLRQRRGPADPVAVRSTLVYLPTVPGVSDAAPTRLEDDRQRFWGGEQDEADLASIETPMAPPDPSHPLLRRLGSSPFPGEPFPLIGLLATCYDAIGRHARGGREEDGPADGEGDVEGDVEAESPD